MAHASDKGAGSYMFVKVAKAKEAKKPDAQKVREPAAKKPLPRRLLQRRSKFQMRSWVLATTSHWGAARRS